jgi:hypothetical protein
MECLSDLPTHDKLEMLGWASLLVIALLNCFA